MTTPPGKKKTMSPPGLSFSTALSSSPLRSLAFNFLGILTFFNGPGKGMRFVPLKRIGLHSSGTLGCITPQHPTKHDRATLHIQRFFTKPSTKARPSLSSGFGMGFSWFFNSCPRNYCCGSIGWCCLNLGAFRKDTLRPPVRFQEYPNDAHGSALWSHLKMPRSWSWWRHNLEKSWIPSSWKTWSQTNLSLIDWQGEI